MKKNIIIALLLMFGFILANPVWANEGKQLVGTININTATAQELMLLPGIGQARAQLILEARKAKPFSKKEDLLEIKGIGPKMLERWGAHVVVDGNTRIDPKPAAVASQVK